MSGLKDSSGIRVYYSTNLREHDAGVLQVGDGSLRLAGSQIDSGLSSWSFDCPASCFESNWPDQDYHILSVQLHMHQVGTAMSMKQFRDGEEIKDVTTEFYDFRFQDVNEASETDGMIIRHGDSFRTEVSEQIWARNTADM